MASTTFSPILLRSYDYEVIQYDFTTGILNQTGSAQTLSIGAIEIEFHTVNHWWIFFPSNYHDSFFNISFDPTKSIPTQVTGAVGESIAIILMERLFGAINIHRITPHPSSKTADFEMDINENGRWTHAIVESKGSNMDSTSPYFPTITQGVMQLLATRLALRANEGYLIITSYPANRIFLIKVF